MKTNNFKLLLLLVILIFSFNLHGYTAKFNPSLQEILLIKQGKIKNTQAKKSLLKSLSDSGSIPLYISVIGKGSVDTILQTGGIIRSQIGEYFSAKIPTSHLDDFYNDNSIEFLCLTPKATLLMDNAGPTVYADQTYSKGYTGNNVIIGIVDSGIDVNHPDFKSDIGLSRIIYLWDQTKSGTKAPSPFNYGTEWTKQDIDNSTCTANDESGHGTHVAGIASGSGYASDDKYRGISPGANIIFVKMGGYMDNVYNGIEYIFKKADELNKPCVINLSLGHHGGNHKADYIGNLIVNNIVSAYGNEGHIIVWAAGNEGNEPRFTTNIISATTDTEIFCTFSGINQFVFYYTSTNLIPVALIENGGNTNIGFTTGVASSSVATISMGEELVEEANRKYIKITTTSSASGVYKIVFDADAVAEDIPVYAYLEDSELDGQQFNNPVYDGTIGSQTAQSKSISVGAIVTKTNWVNYEDIKYCSSDMTNGIDNIAYFSSRGPTPDGQNKPEISAPGAYICSTLSSTMDPAPSEELKISANYFLQRGTSMATPVVTGIIAQLLEKNPKLTVSDVREIFKNTAINSGSYKTDAGTWDSKFGYGVANLNSVLNSDIAQEKPDISVRNNVLNFSSSTDNKYILLFRSTTSQMDKNIKIKIIDKRGNLIKQFDDYTINEIEVKKYEWDGIDQFGRKVQPGIYYSLVEIDNTVSRYTLLVVNQ